MSSRKEECINYIKEIVGPNKVLVGIRFAYELKAGENY